MPHSGYMLPKRWYNNNNKRINIYMYIYIFLYKPFNITHSYDTL